MRGLLLCALSAVSAACSTASQSIPAPESVRHGLQTRAAAFLALQDSFLVARRLTTGVVDTGLVRRAEALDSANTAWMGGVLPAKGWFREADVGADGLAAAFLLLQTSPDTGLQARVLPLLRDAVARGEAPGKEYAILSDRLAVRRGLPQDFGTQTIDRNGQVEFLPIADSAGVDARRAAVGLMPLKAYVQYLDSLRGGR